MKASAAPIANMKDWIESQPEASYEEWERRANQKSGPSEPSLRDTNDESEDELNEEWLRNVMFSPSCGALRQVACSIVETVCQVRHEVFHTEKQTVGNFRKVDTLGSYHTTQEYSSLHIMKGNIFKL